MKGPFWFIYLKYFSCVDGFVIDYMHGICSGVMKLLLNLWFSKEYKHCSFSFFSQRQAVNSFLKGVKPTVNVTRIPRSLDDLVYWKSSEYRNFLLYWGIPILKYVLTPIYLMHFCLLVKGVFLLSTEDVSAADLVTAEACLHEFVKTFADLYDLQFITMNVHQLVHLGRTVKCTGPLYSNNCFVYESLNGFLVQHIHGTQGIDTQIVNTISLIQAIPVFSEKFLSTDPEVEYFISSMNTLSHTSWNAITSNVYRIGAVSRRKLNPTELMTIQSQYSVNFLEVNYFLKIFLKSATCFVYGSEYSRLVQRNQSVIKFSKQGGTGFAYVKYFAEFTNDDNKVIYVALIHPISLKDSNSEDHIKEVRVDRNRYSVIEVTKILCACIYVRVAEREYVCDLPNRFDTD